jgi:gamma-glutamylcyclotransferase (GGCT)/AIG2-like uncharacterized protein YtfP
VEKTQIRLIVYGTLMEETFAASMLGRNVPKMPELIIQGLMHDFGSFPGLELNPKQNETYPIQVKVLDLLDEKELARLDRYEGCPRLYTRETVTIDEIKYYIYQPTFKLIPPAPVTPEEDKPYNWMERVVSERH